MVSRYFNVWLAFFRNTLSRDMEFKMNFIFEIFIDAIYYGSLFFFFKIIFQFTDSLGDFNQDAIIIFLIILYLADSLYVFFLGGNVFEVNNKVKTGDLDVKLTYEYHNHTFIFANYLVCSISLILGMFIFYSVEFLIASLVFWYRNFSYAGWLAGELIKYSRRPDSIYKKWFRKALFSIFPMAMITSVPARFLIFGFNLKLFIAQLFIACIFLWLTTIVWNLGLKRYESASS